MWFQNNLMFFRYFTETEPGLRRAAFIVFRCIEAV